MGIKKLKTTSREPRTNGVIETWHRVLNAMLAKVITEKQSDWPLWINYVVWCYNACKHSATGLSPYEVMTGRQPLWSIDLLLHKVNSELQSVPKFTSKVIERMRFAHHTVRENLKASADYMSRWYDPQVHPATFNVGDRVRVLNTQTTPGLCAKWQSFYRDIGTIKRKLNDVTYIISCPKWRNDRDRKSVV